MTIRSQLFLNDYVEVNERRGDRILKNKSRTYEHYRGAIDAYGRAQAIHRDLKTYFRDAGLYSLSGKHYIREQFIEGKRQKIANKRKRKMIFAGIFPLIFEIEFITQEKFDVKM